MLECVFDVIIGEIIALRDVSTAFVVYDKKLRLLRSSRFGAWKLLLFDEF